MKKQNIKPMAFALLVFMALVACGGTQKSQSQQPVAVSWEPFLDSLHVRTLKFFLDTTDPATGLAYDRWPTPTPSSIAAIGFALTSYPIAAERQLITRAEAAQRVLNSLRFMWRLPQDDQPDGAAGYRGLFYHFLERSTGLRAWKSELSTIDTALLMAGVLFCQSYFDGAGEQEQEIRATADSLFLRIDWQWMMAGARGINLGWKPENGFDPNYWMGYNEAMILYLLALGSPTHPVPESAWQAWTKDYRWENHCGQELLTFGPLFGHQYSHCWIDFRGIQDAYMKEKGIDYFENSRRATYAQREYAKQNPKGYRDYSENIWGFTACDGPKDTTFAIDGSKRQFITYGARSVCYWWVNDDGTIAPTAAGGSVAFAPEICIPALETMHANYDTLLWKKYGFVDAFNPSFITPKTPNGWFDHDYLGIDQGPIVIMIENLRNGLVWNVMKKNPYAVKGLQRAGFTGGWLAKQK